MIIDNVCKNIKECNCEYVSIAKNISRAELKLDKNTGLPLTYIIYDNDKKECISIVYNKFDINQDIENSIFDI
jgi:outer membrane lipoprotein-sorting protein